MRVLLIGSGAREHAIAWKISQSKHLEKLYLWPGGDAYSDIGERVDIAVDASFDQLLKVSKNLRIDGVVCGPEAPLADGLADLFNESGIPVFGPEKEAAHLEASKKFAKEVMEAAGIPTASFQTVHSREQCDRVARNMVREKGGVVLKASGLAGGKGVFVCYSEEAVEQGLGHLYSEAMREASQTVVVEELLVGRESSYFTFLGKSGSTSLGSAVDFKRLNDKDLGPNTGGMGCYTPVPWLRSDAEDKVEDLVVEPLLKELNARGLSYTGWLYVGLMWTSEGPKVVEFNVRLGDPEAQVLSVADNRDWLEIIAGKLGIPVGSHSGRDSEFSPSVCVVMTSPSYPYGKDNLDDQVLSHKLFEGSEEERVFGAAIKRNADDTFSPKNGRVLSVVARSGSLEAARQKAYAFVHHIEKSWGKSHYRQDIAQLVTQEEG